MDFISNKKAFLAGYPPSWNAFVHPWGVEPQSKEPESFILSIELRVPLNEIGKNFATLVRNYSQLRGKSKKYL